jgi:glycosyltransferase involved in cell wall biosynthesis
LSQWYPPEPESKIHLLACGLAARGHQVTSITGFPNYPGGLLYPGYPLRWRQWEQRDGVRVLRVPLYPNHSRSSAKRFLNYLSFGASASILGAALCGPADVMWVYHPPLTMGIPAWWIGLWRRAPFVYEIQDMWPETLTATGMLSSPRLLNWAGIFAKFVYRRAEALTVISEGFKRNLIDKGVPAEKIHVIPNWADEDTYQPVARDEGLAREFGLADRFNVMFAGTMGPAQALDTVLEAASQARDVPAAQFVFVGDGIDVERLKQAAQARGLDNVRFVERQPSERMPYFFAWAGALLVHLKRDPLFEITIPSKTLAYLACGRPILCGVAGDAADVVREAQAGLIVPPQDAGALAQAVRELWAMPADRREALGRNGRTAFEQRYTRAVLLTRYEALFEEVIERRKNKQVSGL